MKFCTLHPEAKRSKENRCSKCESLRRMEYRARNLEKELAYRQEYKERELELSRKRHAEDPAPRRASSKKWRENNPDKVRQRNVKQYWSDVEGNKARLEAWREENKERVLEAAKEWRSKNKDKVKQTNQRSYQKADKEQRYLKQKAWAEANRDTVRASVLKWARANPDYEATREANKRKATPAWTDRQKIKEIYLQARQMSKQEGVQYHVDHIVPLIHPNVQGLHVEYNLRIIEAKENCSKGNRHWPNMAVA